jgi:hypothetical protein
MWMYSGSLDPTRVSAKQLSTKELEKSVNGITKMKEED